MISSRSQNCWTFRCAHSKRWAKMLRLIESELECNNSAKSMIFLKWRVSDAYRVSDIVVITPCWVTKIKTFSTPLKWVEWKKIVCVFNATLTTGGERKWQMWSKQSCYFVPSEYVLVRLKLVEHKWKHKHRIFKPKGSQRTTNCINTLEVFSRTEQCKSRTENK